MHPVLYIQSGVRGVLTVNGQFCGPLEGEGQAFPAGRDAEIYIQLFPYGLGAPLTAAMRLGRGRIERLEPQEHAFALLWPDGVIQLELRAGGEEDAAQGEQAPANTLLRYLTLRLAGDTQAQNLLMRPQDAPQLPELAGYEAALPLRFAPVHADPRYDERAGLLRRLAPNVAAVDAALAATVPVGQGMKRIERIEVVRTQGG